MNKLFGDLKTWHLLAADLLLAILMPMLAFLISKEHLSHSTDNWQSALFFILFVVLVRPVLNYLFGLYQRLWRYASVRDVVSIFVSVTAGSIVITAVIFGLLIPLGVAVGFPRSVIAIEWLLTLFGMGGVRFLDRFREEVILGGGANVWVEGGEERQRVLIVGAGDAGARVIREIQSDPGRKFIAVCLVDDDASKMGKSIYGVRVIGTHQDIPRLVGEHRIADIVIAMPSASASAVREIIAICEKSRARIRIQTVPALCELLEGDIPPPHLRHVQPSPQGEEDAFEDRLEQAKQYFADRDVLVTGGCGFIGSHLAQRLHEYGARVTVFDIIDTPRSDIRHVGGDVRDYAALEKAMAQGCVLFHFAAVLGVENILQAPLDVMEVNLRGTINVLNASMRKNVERFVMASSSEVYGQPQHVPIKEDDPLAPRSVYGVSKLASETYCRAFSAETGLKSTCIRFFNVYGPGQSERFVVPIFLCQAVRGEPLIIYGDGAQYRSYTYISDAINGIVLAASHPNGINETFNIGNTQTLSVNDLAQLVIQISGKRLSPVYRSFGEGIRPRQREILSREPDIFKAQNLLKFKPLVPISEGLHLHFESY